MIEQVVYKNIQHNALKKFKILKIQATFPFMIIRNDNNQTSQQYSNCLLYTSPSPRDKRQSRMPSSA